MNRFVHRRSHFALLLTIVCTVALFADAANVTDWFGSTSTIHFEEGVGQSPLSGTPEATISFTLFASAQQRDFAQQHPSPARRVIFDQDSPSLEAVALVHAIAGILHGDDPKPALPSVLPGGALYLQNCSLLI